MPGIQPDIDKRKEAVIDAIDPLAYLLSCGLKGARESGGSIVAFCPFHDDRGKPNFSMIRTGERKGYWKCFQPQCVASGRTKSLFDLHAELNGGLSFFESLCDLEKKQGIVVKTIKRTTWEITTNQEEWAAQCHTDLFLQEDALEKFQKHKGIATETIIAMKVGWEKRRKRYTFPNYEGTRLLNCYRYAMKDPEYKYLPLQKGLKHWFYPLELPSPWKWIYSPKEVVFLCAGQTDTLMAIQNGLPARCITTGEGDWYERYDKFLRGKIIYIVYDKDYAGRTGAIKVAKHFYNLHEKVFILELPVKGTRKENDLCDFFNNYKDSLAQLKAIIEEAEYFEPEKESDDPREDLSVRTVKFDKLHKPELYLRRIKFSAKVVAKSMSPFVAPREVAFHTCVPNCTRVCPLMDTGHKIIKIPPDDPMLIRFVRCNKKIQRYIMLHRAGIPSTCKVVYWEMIRTYNCWEITIQSDAQTGKVELGENSKEAYFIGDNINWNIIYDFEGIPIDDSRTGVLTFFLYKARPKADVIQTFKITEKLGEIMKVVQIKRTGDLNTDVIAIDEKLKERYDDLSCNVTRIFCRRDIHFLTDLWLHSALEFFFQNRKENAFVEALMIGDSKEGKSKTTDLLMSHYHAGQSVDSARCTTAGIIGGVVNNLGNWKIQWGVIPLNNRGAVKVEEIKNLPEGTMEALRNLRTSGVAQINAVGQYGKQEVEAKVRKMFLSNPVKEQMLFYSYGCMAVRKLIKQIEDITRFTMVLVVDAADVDKAIINRTLSEIPKHEHVHTQEVCRQIIMWIWSRKADQVTIPMETEELVIKKAIEVTDNFFKTDIPLTSGSEIRLDILRLATALAGMLASTDESLENIIVYPEHIYYVVSWMNEIFASTAMGYKEYCDKRKSELHFRNKVNVKSWFKRLLVTSSQDAAQDILGEMQSIIDLMLDYEYFSVSSVESIFGTDRKETTQIVKKFLRLRCFFQSSRAYRKTIPFTNMLAEIQRELRDGNID